MPISRIEIPVILVNNLDNLSMVGIALGVRKFLKNLEERKLVYTTYIP